MHRSSLVAAALIALSLVGAGGAEARSSTPPHAVSRQASPAAQPRGLHPGRAASRQAARRSAPRRRDGAVEARPCRSGATVSMFYATEPGRAVRRTGTGLGAGPAAPSLAVQGPACPFRGAAIWT